MKKIEDYLSLINKAATPEQAFYSLAGVVRDYGYDKLVYTLATDHPSIGLESRHGLIVSYPESWMKYYVEKNYLSIDPVHQTACRSPMPFFWSNLLNEDHISIDSRRLMHEAEEAGLNDGVGIPLYGRTGEVAALGLARNEKSGETNYETLAALQLIGTYFHESYKDLIRKTEFVELTAKEKEILIWAAEGKTDAEIAGIIGISLPTVRYRWNNVFKKLNAYGRVYAITKSIRLQLIIPQGIAKNYQKR
jgi:DNA-binding CsgD family transcriptional regulator